METPVEIVNTLVSDIKSGKLTAEDFVMSTLDKSVLAYFPREDLEVTILLAENNNWAMVGWQQVSIKDVEAIKKFNQFADDIMEAYKNDFRNF